MKAFLLGTVLVVIAVLCGIYLTNQEQVVLAAVMENRSPPFALAILLFIVPFDVAALLAGLALGLSVRRSLWWISLAVGVLLLAYHGYWTHYHLGGAWSLWYGVRVILIPPFVIVGAYAGQWLGRRSFVAGIIGWIGLAIPAGLYLWGLIEAATKSG